VIISGNLNGNNPNAIRTQTKGRWYLAYPAIKKVVFSGSIAAFPIVAGLPGGKMLRSSTAFLLGKIC